MPDGRGDGLCRWIRSNWKDLPVIFLTVRGDGSDIVSGFKSGADDYVVKPFELEVLYSRILAVLRRTGNVAEQYLSCDGIRIDQNRHAVFCHSEEVSLSTAEYQLLLYLMRNKGGTVHCSCAQNPLYTEILIRDDGEGFAKEDLPHLFERFYRGGKCR